MFHNSWDIVLKDEMEKQYFKYIKELKKKGIQVISVSLDRDKKKWLEAVKQDKISWLQLADLTIAGE